MNQILKFHDFSSMLRSCVASCLQSTQKCARSVTTEVLNDLSCRVCVKSFEDLDREHELLSSQCRLLVSQEFVHTLSRE